MGADEAPKPTSHERRRAISRALIEENVNDSSNWSVDNMTTIQEQARLYPDRFIDNDAIFYDLSHREVGGLQLCMENNG